MRTARTRTFRTRTSWLPASERDAWRRPRLSGRERPACRLRQPHRRSARSRTAQQAADCAPCPRGGTAASDRTSFRRRRDSEQRRRRPAPRRTSLSWTSSFFCSFLSDSPCCGATAHIKPYSGDLFVTRLQQCETFVILQHNGIIP